MIMRLDVFNSLAKSKSHPAVTPSAWREHSASYRYDLMGMSVMVTVQSIVDHIVDPGRRHLVSWLELIHFSRHVDLFSLRTCRALSWLQCRKMEFKFATDLSYLINH
jgi:hypothetical protein